MKLYNLWYIISRDAHLFIYFKKFLFDLNVSYENFQNLLN